MTVEKWKKQVAKTRRKRNKKHMQALKAKYSVVCPVSEITGEEHAYPAGSGVEIFWDVMGDDRTKVKVCPNCAKHALA